MACTRYALRTSGSGASEIPACDSSGFNPPSEYHVAATSHRENASDPENMSVVLYFSCWRHGATVRAEAGAVVGRASWLVIGWTTVTPSPTRAKAIRCAPPPFAISSSSLHPRPSSIHPSKPSTSLPSPPCRRRSAGWIELHTSCSERRPPGTHILFVPFPAPPIFPRRLRTTLGFSHLTSSLLYSSSTFLSTSTHAERHHAVSCALRTKPRGPKDRGTPPQGTRGRCHVVSHNNNKS